jgi:regulatory protein
MPSTARVIMAGRITALEPQERHTNRFNLYIDDRFVFGLSAVVAANLHVGQTLTDAELTAIEHQEAVETAHEKALRFLEPRPRSITEVRLHLLKKKLSKDAIDEAIVRLSDAGLLDDAAFARYWVENREEFRPRAGRALRYELRNKGLSDTDIKSAIGNVDEDESAYRAGLARSQRWSTLEHREFRDKMGAFLVRRGFTYEVAKRAAERLWEETRDA